MADNKALFFETYRKNLLRAVLEHPSEYSWPAEDVPLVAARMEAAVLRGSHNKDGYAFKQTCKELGIKHTYKAIDAFLGLRKS